MAIYESPSANKALSFLGPAVKFCCSNIESGFLRYSKLSYADEIKLSARSLTDFLVNVTRSLITFSYI